MAKVRKDKKGRVLHKGEMYLKKRGLYSYSYTDPLGERHFLYASDLGVLREKEKQVAQNSLDGLQDYAFARSDINYLFDRYISTKIELRSTTMTNYVYTYDRYVREGFGKKKIVDIRYSDVLIFYKSLLDRGLKFSTVDTVHSLLHPSFQMAVRDSIIRTNPTDGVMAELKKKARSGGSEPRHALEIEEERAFFDFLNKKANCARWRSLFTVMFGTGCRIGEIIGLRWQDVDFENNRIVIDHSITYYPRSDKGYKCEFRVSLPKTSAGIRTIPLLSKVRETLLEERDTQERTGLHCQTVLEGMSGFIFFNRLGEIHNPAGINKVIKRIIHDYNAQEEVLAAREGRKPLLIPHFSCHISRHTFCTRLCENETNVKVIQAIMGHKDIQTTLDIYTDVTEKKKQEAFKDFNENNVF